MRQKSKSFSILNRENDGENDGENDVENDVENDGENDGENKDEHDEDCLSYQQKRVKMVAKKPVV